MEGPELLAEALGNLPGGERKWKGGLFIEWAGRPGAEPEVADLFLTVGAACYEAGTGGGRGPSLIVEAAGRLSPAQRQAVAVTLAEWRDERVLAEPGFAALLHALAVTLVEWQTEERRLLGDLSDP